MKIKEIQELLDPAVLLQVQRGEKRPLLDGWQNFTLQKMSDPQYLASLNHGSNIGIVLGKNSQGLCTIDLDRDEIVEPFLSLNPQLRNTLQTKRGRGCNIWIRIEGEYPKLSVLKNEKSEKCGEWRADGGQTVIFGEAKDSEPPHTPRPYVFLHKGPPIQIKFEEINWPEGWILPWKAQQQIDLYQKIVDRHGEPYRSTETGKIFLNQLFVVTKFATEHLILHEPSEREFYFYDEPLGVWKIQTSDSVKIQFADDLKTFADSQGIPQLISQRTNSLLSALTDLLRGEVEKRDIFQKTNRVIHLKNGMLHLDVDPPELRPFSPEYYSRNRCPFEFVEGADCSIFKQELLASALNEDDINLIQRWCGSLLIGRNLAQKIMCLVGTAGGGKSTLLEIIEKIIGVENIEQLRTEHLAERFEISRFIGKTVLSGKDVAGNFLEAKGAHVLKALVGHDLLSAEKKINNATFHLRGDFGIAISCNSRLRVRLDGDAAAWGRRIVIVEYEKPKPEKAIRDFAGMLLEKEASGILNWMIEGAIKHLAELDQFGDYQLTERQQNRVDSLLAESDSIREFVKKSVVPAQFGDVTSSELVEGYCRFCDERGWNPLPGRKVENDLPDVVLEVHRVTKRNDIQRDGKSKKGFMGLQIMEDDS